MRILHTSDWHLGQNFYGKSREQEHHHFILWLVDIIKNYQVDALIVAGDIFDTGTPPSYARELYNELVLHMQGLGCQLILLAGNHDSVATLNESGRLLEYLDVTMIAKINNDPSKHLVSITDENEQVKGIVCSLPFIRPRDIQTSLKGETSRDKQAKLQQQIKDFYHQVYECAKTQQSALAAEGNQVPIIATGHLTVVGASTSESVRDIYVGTLDAFPASEFPPVDYLALGHIHRAQKIAKSEHLRYCGSPISLSFDELAQDKKVLLVEFDQGKFKQVEELSVPVFQPLKSISGTLNELKEQIHMALESAPAIGETADKLWLELIVDSAQLRSDLNAQVEALTESLPVEVLRLRKQQSRAQSLADSIDNSITLEELGVEDVFQQRLTMAVESLSSDLDVSDNELSEKLTQKFKQVVAQLEENDGEVVEAER